MGLTVLENACVHSTQNRAICTGNIPNCSRTVPMRLHALRYPARKLGAYSLRIGSVGKSARACAKKQRWTYRSAVFGFAVRWSWFRGGVKRSGHILVAHTSVTANALSSR